MKRLMLVAVMVLAMAGVSLANDPHDPLVPTVTETRLISHAGPTVLLVKVWTPFKDARYKIKWVIFNNKGVKIREGNSGWFWWKSGPDMAFEAPIEPRLKGNGYYVKATLQYAPYVEN